MKKVKCESCKYSSRLRICKKRSVYIERISNKLIDNCEYYEKELLK